MADYTDGSGWAKLDTTAACHLADCIRLFTGRAASNRTRMLLYCFSRMREHKTGPSFKVGYRQLAKDCGVTEETAKQFIKFCIPDVGAIALAFVIASRLVRKEQ